MSVVSWIFNNFNSTDNGSLITRTNVGKYYKITSFTPSDSKVISDALSSSTDKVYLNDVKGVLSINYTRNFKNGLTNQTVPERSGNPIISLPPGNNKYVFSKPHGAYALYRKTENEMFLLYNPIPRPEFDRFIRAYQGGMQNAKNDVISSCLANGSEDPICYCIDGDTDNTKFCMNDKLGAKVRQDYERLSPGTYLDAQKICGCANTKCKSDHPFNVNHFRNAINGNPCPSSVNFAICNTSIQAGRDIKAGNINVEQACGVNTQTPSAPAPSSTPVQASAPAPIAPAPAPRPTAPIAPAPAPRPTAPIAPAPAPRPAARPTAPPKPTTAAKPPASPAPKSNTMLYVIIGVVLLLIIIGIAVFFLMGDSTPAVAAPSAPSAPSVPSASRVFRRRN